MNGLIQVIKPQLPSIVRRLMTGAAVALGAHGLLPQSQDAQFVQFGSAVVLAAIPEVWSWLSNLTEQRKLVAAAKTGNPVAPPASSVETKAAMATVRAAVVPPPPTVNLNVAAAPPPLPLYPILPPPVAAGIYPLPPPETPPL